MQVAANPFTSQLLSGAEMLRGVSPALVRQLMPLMDQLTPIYLDVAQGRVEFHPEPQETRALVRSYYGEPVWLHCDRINARSARAHQTASVEPGMLGSCSHSCLLHCCCSWGAGSWCLHMLVKHQWGAISLFSMCLQGHTTHAL